MFDDPKIKSYIESGWAALILLLAAVAVLAISEYGTNGYVSVVLKIVFAIMFFSSMILASIAVKKQAAHKPTE